MIENNEGLLLGQIAPSGDIVGSLLAEKGAKGDTGDTGNGISSITNTSTSGKTKTYTIEYTDGTSTTFDVTDGTDGTNGLPGADGISPTITTSKVGKVTTLTIIDAQGTHTATINDGNDGAGTGDMVKATYDTNDNGIVDNAERVNNHIVNIDVPELSKTASGSTITFNDGTDRVADSLVVYGNSIQGSNPSPDNPQTITNVTGTIQIAITDGDNTQNVSVNLDANELCKAGNIKDELVIKNGNAKIIKRIGKVVLDGSEAWFLVATYTNNKRLNCKNYVGKVSGAIISSHFVEGQGGTDTTNIDIHGSSGEIMITAPNSMTTDVNTFKQWLSNNNVTAYYELETPTEIDLGSITQPKTYEGTNNITLTTNITTTMDITYLTDNSFNDLYPTKNSIKTINNQSLIGTGNININSGTWGNITGTLSNQTDLQNALDSKIDFFYVGSVDLNNTVEFYHTANFKANVTNNAPLDTGSNGYNIIQYDNLESGVNPYATQIAIPEDSSRIFIRTYNNNVWSSWKEYQEKLISGTNIKTINNQSILGSGNINASGDTLPIGGIVQYNGESVPEGYELVDNGDYCIVENGNNSNGNWVKFSDGTMICTLNISVSDQAINTAYGNLYIGSRLWTFPQVFKETPSVSCGLFHWGNSASWGGIYSPTTNQVYLRGFDVLSRDSGTNCRIQAIAIGRWK